MISVNEIKAIDRACLSMRKNILRLAYQAGSNGAHIGPSLSLVEILAVLYLHILRYDKTNPQWEYRDRFLLSKGHGALGYYTALYEAGIIPKDLLETFEQDAGGLPGQPSKNRSIGIEYSGGSLGLGLSYGVGIALASKMRKMPIHTYVLMGDGELDEGTVWESAMFAKHHKLSDMTAIIDRNRMQSDGQSSTILDLDLQKMWKGFGWSVITCNGHNVEELCEAFQQKTESNPKVIIANTVKGKGVSFMENSKDWHHNRLTEELYKRALTELDIKECDDGGV